MNGNKANRLHFPFWEGFDGKAREQLKGEPNER